MTNIDNKNDKLPQRIFYNRNRLFSSGILLFSREILTTKIDKWIK